MIRNHHRFPARPTALAAASIAAAFALTASALAPVALARSASRATTAHCTPRPGSTACLSYLFADNGRHFNAKVWQAEVERATSAGDPALVAKYVPKFNRLLAKAKTQAEKDRLQAELLKLVHAHGNPNTAPAPPEAKLYTLCMRISRSVGYPHDKTGCQGYAQLPADLVVISWQLGFTGTTASGKAFGPVITVRFANGAEAYLGDALTSQTLAASHVPFPNTPAYTAVDSPLAMIAYFKAVRALRYSPAEVFSKPGTLMTIPEKNDISAEQLLGLWGWGYTDMRPSVALMRIMADAGFNPIIAGGPNVPPGHAWPSVFAMALSRSALARSGWLYTRWPEIAIAPRGVPGVYA